MQAWAAGWWLGAVNGKVHDHRTDWEVQFCPNKLECSILDIERLSYLSKVTIANTGTQTPGQSDPRAHFETVMCENGCTGCCLGKQAGRGPLGCWPAPRAPPHSSTARLVVGLCVVVVVTRARRKHWWARFVSPFPVREGAQTCTHKLATSSRLSDLLTPYTSLLPLQRKQHVPTQESARLVCRGLTWGCKTSLDDSQQSL